MLRGRAVKTARSLGFLSLSIVLGAVACGSSDGDALFVDSSKNETQPGGGTGFAPNADAGAKLEACVTSAAEGEAVPVHLVFMYDKSGSMREESRWSSCASAMTSFFAASATSGMSASLSFFSYSDSCDVELYAKPAVAMRPLPDATSFQQAIAKEGPSGKTPTLPAIKGAIKYAKQVEQSLAGNGKVAIVLVTDGIPNGCGSTPDNAGAEAATVAKTIPTYVIGVGPALENLDTIAKGGGTTAAMMVSTSDPAKITADLTAALGKVKSAVGCEYGIPAPPPGETLDFGAVNVVFTPKNGAPSTLDYSSDCKTGQGWHYDDPASPKRIVMCKATCDALLAGAADGKVQIQFGCATRGEPPR